MTNESKIFFNKASSEKLGWKPNWFNCSEFDEDLLNKIGEFQKNHGLTEDQLCGEQTYKRIYTEHEAKLSLLETKCQNLPKDDKKYIICNGERVEIDWKDVSLFNEKGGLKLDSGFRGSVGTKRDVHNFVIHWDSCLNSNSCVEVLKRRNLGVQFCVDNSGRILQLGDANLIFYHVGSLNDCTIGVEISNAFYPKYQGWYTSHGFLQRPIVQEAIVHGEKLTNFMGFYPMQIEALKALIKAVSSYYNIPLQVPLDDKGELVTDLYQDAIDKKFRGVITHLHVDKNKIDCAGLEIDKIVNEIKV